MLNTNDLSDIYDVIAEKISTITDDTVRLRRTREEVSDDDYVNFTKLIDANMIRQNDLILLLKKVRAEIEK